jgi:hypothetical protein
MKPKIRSIVPGVVFLLFGVWILLGQIDALSDYFEKIYPFFIIAIAVCLLVEALWKSRTGTFFWSVVVFEIGVFFLLRNMGWIPYYGGEEYWPLFFLAFGFAFFLQFIFNPRQWGVLIPAFLFQYAGLFLVSETMDPPPQILGFFMDHFGALFLLTSGVALLSFSLFFKNKD